MTKVIKLKVKNFEGLKLIDIEPGAGINLVRGPNASGKTSLVDAIRTAFTNRPERETRVHTDAETGVIYFELSDGTAGYRHVDRSGYTAGDIDLEGPDGTKVRGPQSFLNQLLGSGFGFNPIEFLELNSGEQAELMLKLADVDIEEGELKALSGKFTVDVEFDQNPLVVIDEIESGLFNLRTDVNRRAREAGATRSSLEAEIPADFEPGRNVSISELTTELSAIQARNQKRRHLKDKVTRIKDEITRLAGELSDAQSSLGELGELESTEGIEEQIAKWEEYQDARSKYKQLQKVSEEEKVANEKSKCLTELIEAAREMPSKLLENAELPIGKLGVKDGQLAVNGVPIQDLSGGERLEVALDIAEETLGELQVILVDGINELDRERRERVYERLSRAGVQAFITKIGGDELEVVTDADLGVLVRGV